jgi:aspartyl aminopeptidase
MYVLSIFGGKYICHTHIGGVESRLVHVKKALCRIPTLAIHLSVDSERTTFTPNLQSHFPPLLATKITDVLWQEKEGNFMDLMCVFLFLHVCVIMYMAFV